MKFLAIFDNGGETLDRYTFVTDVKDPRTGYYDMLATDSTGAGFSQWSDGQFNYHGDNKHLGKQIQWRDLPEELQNHVSRRMTEE